MLHYLYCHHSVSHFVQHFVDCPIVSSTYFTKIFHIISCKVKSLQNNNILILSNKYGNNIAITKESRTKAEILKQAMHLHRNKTSISHLQKCLHSGSHICTNLSRRDLKFPSRSFNSSGPQPLSKKEGKRQLQHSRILMFKSTLISSTPPCKKHFFKIQATCIKTRKLA